MFDDSNWLAYAYLWQDSPVWYWFAAGLVLLALELALDGSFFLFFPLGLGAVAAGIANLIDPTLSIEMDFVVMAVTAVTFAVIARWLMPKGRAMRGLNRMHDHLLGKESVLEKPIENGRGQISLRGSMWTVRGPDLAQGTRVRIIGHDGNTLMVEGIAAPGTHGTPTPLDQPER